MDVSGQLHVPVTLPPGKQPPVPIICIFMHIKFICIYLCTHVRIYMQYVHMQDVNLNGHNWTHEHYEQNVQHMLVLLCACAAPCRLVLRWPWRQGSIPFAQSHFVLRFKLLEISEISISNLKTNFQPYILKLRNYHTDLLDGRGVGFLVPVGSKFFLFSTSSRPALGSTQPPIQWVPGTLSPGENRPGREADHSPPTRTYVKNTCIYLPIPPYTFIAYSFIS
jgi:hypothetical protein